MAIVNIEKEVARQLKKWREATHKQWAGMKWELRFCDGTFNEVERQFEKGWMSGEQALKTIGQMAKMLKLCAKSNDIAEDFIRAVECEGDFDFVIEEEEEKLAELMEKTA